MSTYVTLVYSYFPIFDRALTDNFLRSKYVVFGRRNKFFECVATFILSLVIWCFLPFVRILANYF